MILGCIFWGGVTLGGVGLLAWGLLLLAGVA